MIRRALLAGLLAGCSHPLPPQDPPRWRWDTSRATSPYRWGPGAGTLTPQAPARPPSTVTPGPAKGTPAPARTPNPFDGAPFVPLPNDPADPPPAVRAT